MLNIQRAMLDNLEFDFAKALSDFAESKKRKAADANLPEPVAHPMVEAAFNAGGFQVLDFPDPASGLPMLPTVILQKAL